MVTRVHMAAGRLLLSRPGFAAHPDMPHAQKAFDSDWAYAGQLIASGWADDPATPADPQNVQATFSSAPWVIGFPQCPFIPTVLISGYYSPTYRLRRTRKGRIQPRSPIGLFSINRAHTWVGAAAPYNNQDKYRFEITRRSIVMHRTANDRLADAIARLQSGLLTLRPDAVGTRTQRSTHDDAPQGFIYIVPATRNGGSPTVYFKLSNRSGHWSVAQSL